MPGLDDLNSLAGIAAIINGLLLWPIVRSLKAVTSSHHARLTKLETAKARKGRKKRP